MDREDRSACPTTRLILLEKSACRATSENACIMTLARVSLARGRGRARRLDPTFSIQAFDRQPRKSSLAILPMWASAPKAPLGAERAIGFAMRGGGLAAVRRSGRGGGSLLRSGAPLGAAVFDESEAPHALCGPVWGRGGKVEVDEIGAAAWGSGVAGVPDGAVAGEVGEELGHRDFAAKYGADIPMTELLAHLAGDCAIWDTRHPGAPRCGAYFVDLDFPAPPPDRPTEGMRRLRLVKGGG